MEAFPRNPEPPVRALPGTARARTPEPSPLREFAGLIRRNRLLLVVCLLFVLGGTAFANRTMTPVYRASVSLRIDDKREALPTLDALSLMAENEINTEVEMLRSRLLADAVVDSLGLRLRLLEPRVGPRSALFAAVHVAPQAADAKYRLRPTNDGGGYVLEQATTGTELGTLQPGLPATHGGITLALRRDALPAGTALEFEVEPMREAAKALLESLDVTRRTRDANIVDIEYENTDPVLAQAVPDALARLFLRDRLTNQRTETRSTAAFLREQIDKLEGQLRGAENRLRSFREQQGVVSLGDQASSEVGRLIDLKARRDALDAERAALARVVADAHARAATAAEGEPSAYRDLVAFPSLLRNQAASGLLTSLAEAEDKLTELLGRRSLQDPEVQVLQDRVRQLDDQLRAVAETYLASITHEVAAMDASLTTTETELAAIPAKEIEYKRLERESALLADLYTLLQSRLKEAEIAAAAADPSVRIVDAALLPIEPIRPRPLVNLTLALAVGLLIGVTMSYMRERTDDAVHSRRDLQAATGLPIIGGVPRAPVPAVWRQRLRGAAALLPIPAGARAQTTPSLQQPAGPMPLVTDEVESGSPLLEAYSRVATNLSFLRAGAQLRTLVVTSALEGEGKTTSAINLALTLARHGKRVLLIDGDLRRGTASRLGSKGHPGFADVLSGFAPFERVVQKVMVGGNELHFMGVGWLPDLPAKLLASDDATRLLDELAAAYDYTIIDSPPLNVVADAALLAARADGVIVVARAGRTPAEALTFAIEQLQAANANVLGVVLNDIDTRDVTYDPSFRYYRSAYAERA
jgi:polysaccharide biosynthesis transport protein